MHDGDTGLGFELLTQKETAKMLRMSEAWFERQRWEKKGIPYVKVGGRVFYDQQHVAAWLEQQKIKLQSGQ